MASEVLLNQLQTDPAGFVPVPVRFDWLRHLDAKGITTFFVELLETIWKCQEAGEWEKVGQLLSAWEETAYLMQDPVLLARVREAKHTEPKENIPLEVARAKLGI